MATRGCNGRSTLSSNLLVPFLATDVAPVITGSAPPSKDGKRKAKPGKQRKEEREEQADIRNQRKTSLKLGTGRKGRAAETSGRRGSLKKRDRSAEKEAKLAAAEERRTVRLPE